MVLTCIMEPCVFICYRSPDFYFGAYAVCPEMRVVWSVCRSNPLPLVGVLSVSFFS